MYFLKSCTSTPDTLTCLRQADVNVLHQSTVDITFGRRHGHATFIPVVDGTFITDRSTVLLNKAKLNTVRTVIPIDLIH